VIEGGNAVHAVTFRDCDHRGVGPSEWEIPVLGDEFTHPLDVGGVEEGHLGVGPVLEHPADFGEHGSRQEAATSERTEELRVLRVSTVTLVKGGYERVGVEDGRDPAQRSRRRRIRSRM
jgi:hypothetical protein